MPYITRGQRENLAAGTPAHDVGELTYQLQQQLKDYIDHRPKRFYVFAECFGALVCAAIDLAHRKLIPYENLKQEENGDVW